MINFNKPGCRPATDRLAQLPDEVLVQVFEAVGKLSKRDLCNVSRLNKRYHGLADAVLYKTVHFLAPELHLIFSESLQRRPRRGSAIYEAKIAYPASDLSDLVSQTSTNGSANGVNGAWPFQSLSQTVARMSNLETLDIAVPHTLLPGIGKLFNGPFDLACLKSCTLFYQTEGDQYWDLQENIHIFAHPTVETLVIKRAKLDERGFDMIERPECTALSKLQFIECDINDEALSELLKFPEALKEFVMTQKEDPEPELEESSYSIRDYILALEPACRSLETITIDFPLLQSGRPLELREFDKLKTLRLNWDYQLFGKSSKKPRYTQVGMPRNLETLEFFNRVGTDPVVTDLFTLLIERAHVYMKKLNRLIVTEADGEGPIPSEIEEACRMVEGLQLDIVGRLEPMDLDED